MWFDYNPWFSLFLTSLWSKLPLQQDDPIRLASDPVPPCCIKIVPNHQGSLQLNLDTSEHTLNNPQGFHWPLDTFHWPFINEKKSMFTFASDLFVGHRYFSLHFQPLSAFRGQRKKEFGRKRSWRKQLTTITTCARRSMSNWSLCLLYSLLFIFSKSKCISKAWRKLMNYKQENRIPWLSLTLTISKIFPDLTFKKFPAFSLTLNNFRFSPSFPRPWQPWTRVKRKILTRKWKLKF